MSKTTIYKTTFTHEICWTDASESGVMCMYTAFCNSYQYYLKETQGEICYKESEITENGDTGLSDVPVG
jgi:hypothetical protein